MILCDKVVAQATVLIVCSKTSARLSVPSLYKPIMLLSCIEDWMVSSNPAGMMVTCLNAAAFLTRVARLEEFMEDGMNNAVMSGPR